MRPVKAFFRGCNRGFEGLASGYGGLTRRLARLSLLVVVVYAGLLAATGWQFQRSPTGLIPSQDQGYLITVIQLPPGASLERNDAVVREIGRAHVCTPVTNGHHVYRLLVAQKKTQRI